MQNFNPRVSGLFLLCLILVYIVILAGGTVRATGAGMGCPDWPLCFGKFIPPTSEAELPENWKNFLHGSQSENPSFNPVHTWTEYINRLAGALLGLASLILVFFCFVSNKVTNKTLYFAMGALLSVIFNGWLGSQVVASDLRPLLVSLHMMGAFLVQMFLILGFINSLSLTGFLILLTNLFHFSTQSALSYPFLPDLPSPNIQIINVPSSGPPPDRTS